MDQIKTGTEIGQYRVVSKIGEGGMGTVYKVFDTGTRRYSALKMIRPDNAGKDWDESRKRFSREIYTMAQLRHPNIAIIYTSGEYEGSPYFVMELLSSYTLQDMMGRPMLLEAALNKFLPLLDGVVCAHDNNVLHRDIKPSNVLFRGDDPVLTDFGIAKFFADNRDDDLTKTGIGMGTWLYMSPEQAMGLPVDGRTDEFSLAVMLYEMITGKRPYSSTPPAWIDSAWDPIQLPDIDALPQELQPILRKALARDPDNRYLTVRAFGNALRGIADIDHKAVQADITSEETKSSPALPADATVGSSASLSEQKKKSILPLLLCLCVLAAVGIAVFFIPGIIRDREDQENYLPASEIPVMETEIPSADIRETAITEVIETTIPDNTDTPAPTPEPTDVPTETAAAETPSAEPSVPAGDNSVETEEPLPAEDEGKSAVTEKKDPDPLLQEKAAAAFTAIMRSISHQDTVEISISDSVPVQGLSEELLPSAAAEINSEVINEIGGQRWMLLDYHSNDETVYAVFSITDREDTADCELAALYPAAKDNIRILHWNREENFTMNSAEDLASFLVYVPHEAGIVWQMRIDRGLKNDTKWISYSLRKADGNGEHVLNDKKLLSMTYQTVMEGQLSEGLYILELSPFSEGEMSYLMEWTISFGNQ